MNEDVVKNEESSESSVVDICELIGIVPESSDSSIAESEEPFQTHSKLTPSLSKRRSKPFQTHFKPFKTNSKTLKTRSEYPSKRVRRSAAWNFFTVRDSYEKRASCNLCGKVCCYKSITNLLKHAKRMHTERSHFTQRPRVQPMKRTRVNVSKAWQHFRDLDPKEKTALCLVCKRSFSYASSISNLRKHIHRKHPEMITAAPGNYDSESHMASEDHAYIKDPQSDLENNCDSQQEQNETDVVEVEYLDIYQDDVVEETSMREKTSTPIQRKNVRDRRTTGDNTTYDSLDHFGSYIVSLLRHLPKNVSNRLQMQFVQQVMEEQAMCEANPQ